MNFQLSQFILIVAILLFVLYIFRVRTLLTDRVIYLVLVVGGIILVLYPNLSTWIANLIGIGRGTDLILYIAIIFSLFQHVSNASRFKSMERQITTLTRRLAITEARNGEESINKLASIVNEKIGDR